ncbi:glycosyltransferase [uncultured Brevundimonas sp.]|uniref:glycosyltransferase n=1 Tax=uncultured Brevundimonas sp. TaxID=213418 RepID=UPI0025EB2BD8|nr:glycosyltransferase [uncultured Brevundimonas sp.]
MAHYDRSASREDVAWLYKLVLGRVHESDDRLDEMQGLPLGKILADFFQSAEFKKNVVAPLGEGRPPHDGREPFPVEATEWLTDSVCLEPESIGALRHARSWSALYAVLFSSHAFGGCYGLAGQIFDDLGRATLSAMAKNPAHFSRRGDVDEIAAGGVRGWSVDPVQPDRSSTVELWVDGDFVAAAPVDRFRRDIQDRFGGNGRAGFFIETPRGLPDHRAHRLEVRDGLSGRLLKGVDRPGTPAKAANAQGVREELAAVRKLLAGIERRLRDEERASADQLEHYSAYYDAVYRLGALPFPERRDGDAGLCVVVDVAGVACAAVEDAIRALAGQRGGPSWKLAICGASPDQQAFIEDLDSRIGWTVGRRLKPFAATLFVDEQALLTFEGAEEAVFVFAPASGVCAPDALAWLGSCFRRADVVAAYADEDHLASGPEDVEEAEHVAPLFKPAFDPDLLAQTPYVGRLLAIRGRALKAVGLDRRAGHLAVPDALLRLGPSLDEVSHVGRVLYSRRPDGGTEDLAERWGACVSRAYASARGVEVGAFTDIAGACVPGAVCVRRKAAASATIIIPTRDGRALLEPCVESILSSLSANQAAVEILIIDHESSDPATLAYLDDLRRRGAARIMPFSGAFNWALMNNRAAAETGSDVLIFLNNDTLVLSPDWIDALCAEALRPEIGVVGARLLYQDGAIQHAGFVWREGHPGFLIHDGVGEPAIRGGYLGRHALTHACVAVTGACMAVAREKFQELGGFDAGNFPVEGNDVDLCLRAWSRNYRVLYSPHATLYHLESVSRGFSRDGEKKALAGKANAKLLARWDDGFRTDPWFNPHFSREGRPYQLLRRPR